MQLFLATAPEHTRQAMAHTASLAHAAYFIGPGGNLAGHGPESRFRGGILLLRDQGCGSISDPSALVRQIRHECAQRGYCAVAADFELPANRERAALVRELGETLERSGKGFYVPEHYGRIAPQARVMICTALSGGSLRLRLEEAGKTWGQGRLALDLQRLRMSFPLPCPTGCGVPLQQEELESLMAKHRPSLFYSTDLCARYFTCREQGQTRFVLFDDADTLWKKIELGRSMGISTGFLLYPEVEDLLAQLFRKQKSCRPVGDSR